MVALVIRSPRPGYGPAHRVADRLVRDWEDLVKLYLQRSQRLRRAICLVDSARGLRKEDERLWETVMDSGRQMMVVLTKADRCHPSDLHRNVAEVLAALQHLDPELIWPCARRRRLDFEGKYMEIARKTYEIHPK